MSPAEKAILVVQVVATCVIAATLVVYFLQLRTMRRQLETSKEAATASNILGVVNFLQDEQVRKAREVVRKRLRSKTYNDWDEEEKREAARVCSTYDVAAILIRSKLVPMKLFVENWGPSIEDCYDILKPYIEEMQRPEHSGPAYLDDFGWLYNEVKSHKAKA